MTDSSYIALSHRQAYPNFHPPPRQDPKSTILSGANVDVTQDPTKVNRVGADESWLSLGNVVDAWLRNIRNIDLDALKLQASD
ncbi:hypothetical protein NM208_g13088 [Fusarium decemcellulare]|uniref:Uncharacterized protein n=1 Tax=Fusarium decemcellulare TaxID=57161 RepID=A0ACC1RQH5_9HYPO|nr:hypothetical protein NM208_g13088 [Fusarium decemcellulare]